MSLASCTAAVAALLQHFGAPRRSESRAAIPHLIQALGNHFSVEKVRIVDLSSFEVEEFADTYPPGIAEWPQRLKWSGGGAHGVAAVFFKVVLLSAAGLSRSQS